MTDDAADREPRHPWHPLPGILGEAITGQDGESYFFGGYLIRRLDDGVITIYRMVDRAPTRADLSTESDYVAPIDDDVVAGEQCGSIAPPTDGWETETETLRESGPNSTWPGYSTI